MANGIDVVVKLDEAKINSKVNNDRFGTFVSHEWHRLINPYTPRDTGELMRKVEELPFELHYTQKYASKMYYGISDSGKPFKYQRKNPCSTDHWDVKAAKAGQREKLYRTLNAALKSGRF